MDIKIIIHSTVLSEEQKRKLEELKGDIQKNAKEWGFNASIVCGIKDNLKPY